MTDNAIVGRKVIIYPGVDVSRVAEIEKIYPESDTARREDNGLRLYDNGISTIAVYQTKTARIYKPTR